MNSLVQRELMDKNPCQNIKELKTVSKAHRYFSPELQAELEAWMLANDRALYRFTRLIYYCFVRPGELIQIRAKDVNLTERRLMVSGEMSKNRKAQYVAIPSG